MGTDLRRSIFDFDPICVHPWNPWLKQLCPTKNVEELSLRAKVNVGEKRQLAQS